MAKFIVLGGIAGYPSPLILVHKHGSNSSVQTLPGYIGTLNRIAKYKTDA